MENGRSASSSMSIDDGDCKSRSLKEHIMRRNWLDDDYAIHRERTGAEYSDSYGHSVVQTGIAQQLMQQGLPLADGPDDVQGLRYNRTQVVGRDGRLIKKKKLPD